MLLALLGRLGDCHRWVARSARHWSLSAFWERNVKTRFKIQILIGGFLFLECAAAIANSGWVVEKKTDPLTDEGVTTAISTYSAGRVKRTVVVRCIGKQLNVIFDFGEFLNNDQVPIRYRLNKTPLTEAKWFPSAEGTAVFADEDAEIARMLMQGGTFIVEAEDYRGQPHRSTFNLSGSSGAIQPVLKQCGLSSAGMDQEIEGLRKDIALDLERWGKKNISMGKRVLMSLGAYNGPQDSTIEPGFALAVQRFYDDYIAKCKEGKLQGVTCTAHRITWEPGWPQPQIMPPILAVIHEQAPVQLREEVGKLKMGE
jgi:hypothetical protein